MVRAHMLFLVTRSFNSEKCIHCHFLYIIIYILPFLDIYRMPSPSASNLNYVLAYSTSWSDQRQEQKYV